MQISGRSDHNADISGARGYQISSYPPFRVQLLTSPHKVIIYPMSTSEGIAHKLSIYPMPTRVCGALVVLLWEWGQGREKVPWKAEVMKGWLMMTSSTRESVGVGGVVTCSVDVDVDVCV